MPDTKFVTPELFAADVKPLKTAALAGVSDAAFREETDRMTALLHALADAEAGSEGSVVPTSWAQVRDIVRAGLADRFFSIGDQLICQRGGANLVWDVIGIDHDTPADPQFTHSMTLQLHDCFPTAMQFDAPEALYYCQTALEAGTYHFTVSDADYQFTLAESIPSGDQLTLGFVGNIPTTISVSATKGGVFFGDPIPVTQGSGGNELIDVNDIGRARFGSNNYKDSAIRQWLNSSASGGSVWTPQTDFDRPPTWAGDTAGFLNGMDADFLAVVGNVNKVTAKSGGGSDITNDKFFLLSRSEVFASNIAGMNEGTVYPYYADYSDYNDPNEDADSNRIKKQNGIVTNWWLRSSVSNNLRSVCIVHATGGINERYASFPFPPVPACNII